jgi:uncharacterized protein (DUF305 family)
MHPAGLRLAGLLAAPSPQAAPIVQPGAPGAAPRTITATEAVELSRTTWTEEDVRFLQHMLVHHAQAVEMVELLRTRAQDQRVRLLGERIALSQAGEMEQMQGWLTDRGLALEDPGLHAEHGGGGHAGHDGHAMPAADLDRPIMPGMLSPAQMAALAAASGPAFDRLFLQGMIQHHQGALDMVDALLARRGAAEDPWLSDFASSVVADQSAEILRMQSVLSDL